MKTFLIAFVAGCIPALATTNGAFAQSTNSFAMLEQPKDFFKIDNNIASAKSNTVYLNDININAMRDFNKSYAMVNNEAWYKTSEGYLADFSLNGIKITLYYNKHGQRTGSVKQYHEEQLDRDVRAIVKREYYDYRITLVKEVETPETCGTPTYVINMEDDNNIMLVRVHDGEMDIYKHLKKR